MIRDSLDLKWGFNAFHNVTKKKKNVERKLSRDEKLKGEYGGIVEEQIRAGVIEEAPKSPSGKRVF